MFNLTSVLSDKDKELISKYVEKYGVAENFIGVDSWLQEWGKSKIKLYKLLGNQLIYSIPFKYEKNERDLERQLRDLNRETGFWDAFMIFSRERIIYPEKGKELLPEFVGHDRDKSWHEITDLQKQIESFCYNAICVDSLIANKIEKPLKIKTQKIKRELQIQAGTKPIKAINKFLTYFESLLKDDEEYVDLMKKFEEYRLAHSVVLNDKMISGDLVFSIHPLDFMTMSDNDSNWQSCMSWVDDGCYHVGTVEMMNSNNVLCCYITNKKNWHFEEDEETGEIYEWNNKKWRQLVYVAPEIIMTGKSYPYKNETISKLILTTLKELSEKVGISYEYGIEKYEDMKYINSIASMDRARDYRMLPKGSRHKRNIIFDTKGMYNDMLNDHCTTYWCIRNKVKKTTLISISGKATCLCCGGSTLEADYDWKEYGEVNLSYNDRYTNCSTLVCEACESKFYRCPICRIKNYKAKMKTFKDEKTGIETKMCAACYNRYIKTCPICKKEMYVLSLANEEHNNLLLTDRVGEEYYNPILMPVKPDLNPEFEDDTFFYPPFWKIADNCSDQTIARYDFIPIFGHADCIEKYIGAKLKDYKYFRRLSAWHPEIGETVYTKILPYRKDYKEFYKPFFYQTLSENVDIKKRHHITAVTGGFQI